MLNNDNNITPIFIGLNKATQKTRTLQEDSVRKDKEWRSEANVF
jgi:hypothetical protein